MYNQYAEIDLLFVHPDMFENIEVTRRNAEKKAYSTWPENLEKRVYKKNYLFDHYVMRIFWEAGISAIYPSALMQCVNDSIAPSIIDF